MTSWADLFADHRTLRESAGRLLPEIRQQLHRLAREKHAQGTVPHRFSPKRNRDVIEWSLESEPLEGLRTGVAEARLTVLALTRASRRDHLDKLTVMVEGTRTDGSPWVVAAHLDGAEGEGACSHALLHCHVGPTLDHQPKIRVPLPALAPADLLDWALTVAIDGWEPAPWATVAPKGL